MAQIRVDADDFSLRSSYSCIYELAEVTGEATSRYTTSATTGTTNVKFAFDLPSGATVRSAEVHATLGTPAWSPEICTINGMTVSTGSTVSVPVEIENGADSITVPFVYKCKPVLHTDHGSVETTNHYGSIPYTDVYLLIETSGGSGYVYRAEGGQLVPYQLCRAEGGQLVPYQLNRAEGGQLVPYS